MRKKLPSNLKRKRAATQILETPPRWEQRTTNRVLKAGRDQILERSRQIVAAAYELLEQDGLEGLTIRAVLTKTGLSRRAFYERFADKDDLMLAVFEQTIRLATDYYSAKVKALHNPLERLKLIVMSIGLGRAARNNSERKQSNRRAAAMSREHLRLAESRPNDLQVALSPLLALIAQQLSDGMQRGSVRTDNPERLAKLVYNIVSTTLHTEFLSQENIPQDRAYRAQLATEVWEFCRRAIAA